MATTNNLDLLSMKGKVVLVTGASSGLGAHFARALAAAGACVAAGARRVEKLEQLVTEIRAEQGEAIAVELDVTREDSVEAALKVTEDTFGPVTVLINNAGVADSRRTLSVDEESWDFIMNTNLKAAWRLSRTVAARCVADQLPCSIVNISSILGLRVGFGESTYATAKAGLIQLTRSMAMELASKDVRVNALCPGYFKTELNSDYFNSEKGQSFIVGTPSRRLGELDELTAPLLLLASDAGSFINGVALPVDGGHLVSSL